MLSLRKVPSMPNRSSAVRGEPGRRASLAFDFSCSLNHGVYSLTFSYHWSVQQNEEIIKVIRLSTQCDHSPLRSLTAPASPPYSFGNIA